MPKTRRSLVERVQDIRELFRGGDAPPTWTAEQWTNALMAKLGQAAICLGSDQGPMSRRERDALDAEGIEHLLALAAVALDAAEQLSGLDESQLKIVVLNVPGLNDKVHQEIAAVAAQVGLDYPEAIALLVGLGQKMGQEMGMLGDRATSPMSRGELLREVMVMLEHEE